MFSSAATASGEDQTSTEESQLQATKLAEVLGLLLSAGYFRARAPGLTPFDKVSRKVQCTLRWPYPKRLPPSIGDRRHVLGNCK